MDWVKGFYSCGLTLEHLEPGGGMDWETGRWLPVAPLSKAMSYTARLSPSRARH